MKEETQDKERRPAGTDKHERRAGGEHKPAHGKDHDRGSEHDHAHRHDDHNLNDPRERHRHGHGRPELRDRARRGEVRFLLLDALRDGPKHGYEIIKAIEERSAGQYAPSPGTVYPTLQLLEDQAFVRADLDGERRVYALTDAGKTELAAREDYVNAFWSRFTPSPATTAARHEVGFLRESLEDLNRTVWRGLHEVIERGDQAAIRRVRQLIEQCRNDIRVIISDVSASAAETPATKGNRTK